MRFLLFFRLVEIEKIENPLLVLYVGSAGLLINLIGLVIFHEHSHGHHHIRDDDGDNHKEDALVETKGISLNDDEGSVAKAYT